MTTRLLASIIVLLTFAGCVPNTMHHSNFNACPSVYSDEKKDKVEEKCMTSSTQVVTIEKKNDNEVTNNEVKDGELYRLFFVEFDEQGRLYDDKQLNNLLTYLSEKIKKYEEKNLEASDVSIVTFVHGWRHTAYSDDTNVKLARKILLFTQLGEKRPPQATPTGKPREVVGIYVGWRGKSFSPSYLLGKKSLGFSDEFNDFFEVPTVWDRKNTAQHVAIGSVRELFSYLRSFKQRANELRGECRPKNSASESKKLFRCESVRHLIVGHSFGGLIAYNSQSESLIDSVTRGALGGATENECNEPTGSGLVKADGSRLVKANGSRLVKADSDLTIVINPAVEGARYEPLFQSVKRRSDPSDKDSKDSKLRHFCKNQRPVFIGFSTTTDVPNKHAFPWSRRFTGIFEDSNPLEPDDIKQEGGSVTASYKQLADEETEASRKALGQIGRYWTHEAIMATEEDFELSQKDTELNQLDSANKEMIHACRSERWDFSKIDAAIAKKIKKDYPQETGQTDEKLINQMIFKKRIKIHACMAYVEELNLSFFNPEDQSDKFFCGGVKLRTWIHDKKPPNKNLPVWMVTTSDIKILNKHSDIEKNPFTTMIQQLYHAITLTDFTKDSFIKLRTRILDSEEFSLVNKTDSEYEQKTLQQVISDSCSKELVELLE